MAGNTDREDESCHKVLETSTGDAHNREYPMVFNCNKCSAIIGDSTSWLCVNEPIQAVVLKRVTNKVVECDELFLSPSGPDQGSTFVNVMCSVCSENIGRVYKSTPPHLDETRNVYNLYASKIDSYVLGSSEKHAIDLNKEDGSKISYCFSQIKKLQQVIIEFNNRLSVIEQQLGIENSFCISTSDDGCHTSGSKSERATTSMTICRENTHSAKRKYMESVKDEKLLPKKNRYQ